MTNRTAIDDSLDLRRVYSRVCEFVCLHYVRALKGNWFELSTPKSVETGLIRSNGLGMRQPCSQDGLGLSCYS